MSTPSPLLPSLARIQLLSPLSLLILLVSLTLSSLLPPTESLTKISNDYLTILTPNSNLIGIYWGIIILLLGAQSLILAIGVRKEETRELVVNGVGLRAGAINILMAIWALFWTLKLFLISEIVLLITLLLAISIYLTLLYHSPSFSTHPLDFIFIHTPLKMILCILLSLDIWQNGLLALGWFRFIGEGHQPGGKWGDDQDHSLHSWLAFILILTLSLINSLQVFMKKDIVWAASTIFLNVALVNNSRGKPAQIFVTLILGSAMIFISLISSIGWDMIKKDQEGAIRLSEEEEEEDEVADAVQRGVAVPVEV